MPTSTLKRPSLKDLQTLTEWKQNQVPTGTPPSVQTPGNKHAAQDTPKGIWGKTEWCFHGGSFGKEFAWNAEDLGSIPGMGRFPGGEHGNPLQYPCQENPKGQRSLVGWSTVAKSQTQLSD